MPCTLVWPYGRFLQDTFTQDTDALDSFTLHWPGWVWSSPMSTEPQSPEFITARLYRALKTVNQSYDNLTEILLDKKNKRKLHKVKSHSIVLLSSLTTLSFDWWDTLEGVHGGAGAPWGVGRLITTPQQELNVSSTWPSERRCRRAGSGQSRYPGSATRQADSGKVRHCDHES